VSLAAPPLTDLEIAGGIALGEMTGPERAGDEVRSAPSVFGGARGALDELARRLLDEGPVTVSFSGGRDSSAVLALTTAVARREGLPPPVPVTFRFAGVAATHESDWQELVVSHLGLTDWVRLDLDDELDLLGEAATDCLEAHGLLWPPNTYLHVPLFRAAAGTTLLTGLDGDGLFGEWRWCHAQSVLHGRRPVGWRDLARIGLAASPPAVRRLDLARRGIPVPDWLTPNAAHEFRSAFMDRLAAEPRRWDTRLGWYARTRALQLATGNLERVGRRHSVRVVHPFFEPEVLRALASEGGAAGFGDRTAALRHLFGDVLPAAVIERRSKAVFGGVVWHESSRQFAREWDGAGCNEALVVPERLHAAWRAEVPMFASWTLLHAAWLATRAGSPCG
jgi:asparagine synthase (glutamine-hydrolysing)